MNILSIQSHVAYGHVGNAAATFPLQRMGVEVWPIHTVQFSNHTGYGSWKGRVFDAGMIGELVAGIEQRGVLGECDGVLSGYMGSADIGAAILEAVARVRQANPGAKYCCDPVIGDVGRGIFVREGIPEFMRTKAVPAADIITPNQFELDYHERARQWNTATDARCGESGARSRAARNSRHIACTRRRRRRIRSICWRRMRSGCFIVRTPKLPLAVNGAGDAIAALFFAHYLRSGNIGEALSRAASVIFGVLAKTAETGAREIQLVAAQDEIVKPSRRVRSGSARAMSEAPSIFHIDRLELSFAPKPWAFAVERRAEIDAFFAALRREKPHIWNGRVLLMHRSERLRTASSMANIWKPTMRVFPPGAIGIGRLRSVHDCFSAAAILAADGAFLLGVMGPHTFNGGKIYFPVWHAGSRGSLSVTKVDLDLSVQAGAQGGDRPRYRRVCKRAGLDDGRPTVR